MIPAPSSIFGINASLKASFSEVLVAIKDSASFPVLQGKKEGNLCIIQDYIPGDPKKEVKRLIDDRTKGFCSIVKFAFDFCRKDPNLDFETKFAQIQHELTEILQFQKQQVDFNFQIFADFGGINFHYAGTLNNTSL